MPGQPANVRIVGQGTAKRKRTEDQCGVNVWGRTLLLSVPEGPNVYRNPGHHGMKLRRSETLYVDLLKLRSSGLKKSSPRRSMNSWPLCG